MAQWVEGSLLIPENPGSNQTVGNFSKKILFATVNCVENKIIKRRGIGPLKIKTSGLKL